MSVITETVNQIVAEVGMINLGVNNINATPQSVYIASHTATLLGTAIGVLQSFNAKSFEVKQAEWTAANTGEAYDLWEARQIVLRDEISMAAHKRMQALSTAVSEINELLASACEPVFTANE